MFTIVARSTAGTFTRQVQEGEPGDRKHLGRSLQFLRKHQEWQDLRIWVE